MASFSSQHAYMQGLTWVNHSSLPYLIIRPNGRIVWTNDAFGHSLLGELMSDTWWAQAELTPETGPTRSLHNWLEAGVPFFGVCAVPAPMEAPRIVELEGNPLPIGDKEEPFLFLIRCRDLGERMSSAALVSEGVMVSPQAKGLLDQLQHTRMVYVLKTDLAGNYTYMSESYTRRFGWDEETYIGTNSMESIYPEDHPLVVDAVMKAMRTPGEPFYARLRKLLPDKSLLTTEWEFIGERGADGQLGEVCCIGKDVSEAVRLNETLQAVTGLLEGELLVLDAEAIIRYCSPQFCELTGFARDDLQGKGITRLIHPEDQAIWQQALITPGDTHLRLQHHSGAWIAMAVRMARREKNRELALVLRALE